MASQDELKRRPSPIQILRPGQHLGITPGPNAFVARAKPDEEARPDEAKKQDKPSANTAPVASPLEAAGLSSPRKSGPSPRKSDGRSSRRSDGQSSRKSDTHSSRRSDAHSSSTTGRHGSTALSRHSNRSQRSGASGQLGLIDEEGKNTARAQIEGRAEKKLMQMMGQATDNPDHYIAPAGRYSDASKVSEAPSKITELAKSPKKKIFGLSLPSFGKSTTQLAPPMPSKAAQVLGTTTRPTTAGQQRHTPRPLRPVPRNDASSKSLPAKVYGQRSPRRSPPRRQHGQFRSRTPIQRTKAAVSGGSSSDLEVPPTPPKKDTPPESKDKAPEEDKVADTVTGFPDFLTTAAPIASYGGQSPTKFCPVPAEEYAKLVEPHPVASARALVGDVDLETDDGHVDGAALELEGDIHPLFDSDNAELQKKYPDWWDEQSRKRFSKNGQCATLPPAFYSPSTFSLSLFDGNRPSQNTDTERLLFAFAPRPRNGSMRSDPSRASIDMTFQGDASEIDTTSSISKMVNAAAQQKIPSLKKDGEAASAARVLQELQRRDQAEVVDASARGSNNVQADPSSSKLTDMLSGFSPSKSGYNNDSFPNRTSALPSPLHKVRARKQPPPVMGSADETPPTTLGSTDGTPPPSWLGALPDGSNVLTHFYMCNSHIDVLGRTLYDLVADGRREALMAAKEIAGRHTDLIAALDQRFEDVKADISAVGRTVERVSEQNQTVNAKLDKLLEFIKDNMAERLAQQTKKQTDMEGSIKALQNTVQELQKLVEAKSNPASGPAPVGQMGQNPFSSPLPQHRSQPSLVGLQQPPTDPSRETVPRGIPAVAEPRNDSRFRYHYANNNTANNHGQQWYRPSTAPRENKDESNAFPNANPYLQGTPGQMGGGYVGNNGYGGYYPTGPNEYTFCYSNGGPK